jgi:arabinose-5-phosphate isomerase
LVNSSDVALILPNIPEANKVKAPTTSTTMMLALGDALAVALMEAKNFGNDEYSILHPGGKLGAQFIKVKDLMRIGKELPFVSENQLPTEILFEMSSKHLGCTGVKNDKGKLVGIITDGDLRRHIGPNFMDLKSTDIMTKTPIVITQDMLAVEAIAIMSKKSITNLFVVEDKDSKDGLELVGILHIHDCLRAGIV